eukprot:TRINITY_DN28950_c0_g1_i2.p1 TRINITY_DN28950_c0_g1~~TRINITY_DN28950_c0_g1_i2.p1  ORF type:complete len:209 (+),score=47.89 TRINITY_DN28950_c0_g1_i2:2-628(+)
MLEGDCGCRRCVCLFFFFQAEDGIRDAQESRGLGDVYKRQAMKCSKEDIIGLVAALEVFVDEYGGLGDEFAARWEAVGTALIAKLAELPGTKAEFRDGPADIQPSSHRFVHVELAGAVTGEGQTRSGLYGDAVDHGNPLNVQPTSAVTAFVHHLANGSPRVCVNSTETGILINPQTLSFDELDVMVQRIADTRSVLIKSKWIRVPSLL